MALAKKHCSDDRLYFKFPPEYSLRLTHDSDNVTLCYPSHVSHFFYLPDFGRFSQSRDQPQPGSFLWSKREDPGNEVAEVSGVANSNAPLKQRLVCLCSSKYKFTSDPFTHSTTRHQNSRHA